MEAGPVGEAVLPAPPATWSYTFLPSSSIWSRLTTGRRLSESGWRSAGSAAERVGVEAPVFDWAPAVAIMAIDSPIQIIIRMFSSLLFGYLHHSNVAYHHASRDRRTSSCKLVRLWDEGKAHGPSLSRFHERSGGLDRARYRNGAVTPDARRWADLAGFSEGESGSEDVDSAAHAGRAAGPARFLDELHAHPFGTAQRACGE